MTRSILAAGEENHVRRVAEQPGLLSLPEKTLDDFDFRLRPELNRQVSCATEDRFITQGRSLCLVGATGPGKTHLVVAVGLALRGHAPPMLIVALLRFAPGPGLARPPQGKTQTACRGRSLGGPARYLRTPPEKPPSPDSLREWRI